MNSRRSNHIPTKRRRYAAKFRSNQPRAAHGRDEIVCACDALTVPDALAALTEIQAQILADHGIVPGSRAFEAYAMMSMMTLSGRVRALHAEKHRLPDADAETQEI